MAARWLSPLALFAFATCADAAERNVMVFGGIQTANVWEEVVLFDDIRFLDAGLVGLAGGIDWPLGASRASLGLEAQIVRHFGDQDHWEANLPAVARYRFAAPRLPVESVAFGLGLSYASKVPATEVAREGQSRRTLFYWTAEVAFRTPAEDVSVALRLHHRSSGFGIFGDSGSSNAIVLGVRRNFRTGFRR
jgi:hypothetical protein